MFIKLTQKRQTKGPWGQEIYDFEATTVKRNFYLLPYNINNYERNFPLLQHHITNIESL